MSAFRSRVLIPFVIALCLLTVGNVWAIDLPGPIVDTRWLQDNHQNVKVIDLRSEMESYVAKGHIPGARFISFMSLRANSDEEGIALQDMHLSKPAFEALMRSAGINQSDSIIITHPGQELADWAFATYLYWELRYYGHRSVALLDGGTARWANEKREMRSGAEPISLGNFTVSAIQAGFLATTAQAKDAFETKSAVLLDARPLSQFLGIDKRDYVAAYGHIPGAKVLPFDALIPMGMGKGASFPMKPALLRGIDAIGLTPEQPTIVYCNTGHMASVDWFVLHELLGFRDVALFDGSMHAWAKQGLPTTTSMP